GASMKGEFEQRLRSVIDEIQTSPKPIILFIDEAHTLMGAGGGGGDGDAANLLKPALARGTLRTIAATTWDEYKRHIEKDPALTRRFQVVKVEEPSEEKCIRMMRPGWTTRRVLLKSVTSWSRKRKTWPAWRSIGAKKRNSLAKSSTSAQNSAPPALGLMTPSRALTVRLPRRRPRQPANN